LFNEVTTNLEKILSYEGNNKILYKAEEILIFKRKFEPEISAAVDRISKTCTSVKLKKSVRMSVKHFGPQPKISIS
jgi:hypothetical protein